MISEDTSSFIIDIQPNMNGLRLGICSISLKSSGLIGSCVRFGNGAAGVAATITVGSEA